MYLLLALLPLVLTDTHATEDIYFGRSFAFCGDVDKDGCSDIACGSRVGESCAVVVLSGKTGAVLERFSGTDGFGYEVTAVRNSTGAYTLIAACPLGSPPRIDAISLSDGHKVTPIALGANEFGGFIVPIEDVDGHGTQDILVRVRGDEGAYEHHGISIETGKVLFRIPPSGDPAWGKLLGPSMSGLGRVGEGEECFAIGSRGTVRFFDSTGKCLRRINGSQRFFGRSVCGIEDSEARTGVVVGYGGESLRDRAELGGLVAVAKGGELYEHKGLGYSICKVEDVDSDGVSDFAASQWDGGGRVLVYSGRTGKTLHDLTSVRSFDNGPDLGWRLCAGGDADADGAEDIIVSEYSNYSQGHPEQGIRVYSLRNGVLLRRFAASSL
jgi:hypothetical protein